MSHRNKNLVFTDSDIDEPTPEQKSTNNNDSNNKRKRTDDGDNLPIRRSQRLAEKKPVTIDVGEAAGQDNMDTSGEDDTGSDSMEDSGKNSSEESSESSHKSGQESGEQSSEKSSQDPVEESSVESSVESSEQSSDESGEESSEQSSDESGEDSVEESSIESGEEADDEEDNSLDDFIVDDDGLRPPAKRRMIQKGVSGVISSLFGRGRISTTAEEDEMDYIIDDLVDEPWYQKLSDKKQLHYINKMKELRTFSEKIPTIKDIMDMDIPADSMKLLINQRRELDQLDKLNPDYDAECRKFVRSVAYYSNPDNIKNKDKIKELENSILAQNKSEHSLRERILESEFDAKTKNIIYSKYLAMNNSHEEEAAKTKLWIETVLSIPHKPKKIDIDESIPQNEAISKLMANMMHRLNQKVYGMWEAKEELLCIVVNMISNPKTKNKAIGLYGSPGIGKTLLAMTIAEVLDIPMEQISLGGVTDSSFLEGHSYTYLGSQPGRIAKAYINMKCTNGIFYLDEVDKISKTDKGKEIEHSLLHITDFTQCHDYRDKYMDEIPIDLSNCIFIYSMNTVEELDSALASRIPVVRFDGYSAQEKLEIISKYLLPEILQNYSMVTTDIILPEESAKYLISIVKEEDEYNSKSGVRGLKKALNRIIKRINLYRVASVNGKIEVKLSFNIPNFSLPYTINTVLIGEIIRDKENKVKHQSMYL